ncbi:tight adherence protein B [Lentzea albidocapillata subsp. violacea]|uniref:Tight adherence protein B n=1 Tax=Lentzea albidocapillata subsp. violacea TaxID=128104 RepID=A0A1G9HJE3_9PSEU|nr:type II secretion system F family protein [Lentzea albidocapillata]SDL13100.1 tight adherence protein B [Lentzea albidocapillata subsp. violacea]
MLSLLLLATALIVWPHLRSVRRLRPQSKREVVVPPYIWLAAAATVTYLVAGVGGLVAGAVLAVTGRRILKQHRRNKALRQAAAGLSNGLGGVIDELRVGAHPAQAAESAAEDTPAPAKEVLKAAAAASRLGGDVERTLREMKQPLLDKAVDQLARAWHVSAKHGVALADVLDATKRDLDQRAAFARQVHARMAGPRASALVLAVLPVLGVLLGEFSGARPFHVLTSTAAGQFLLALGAVLGAAGVWWTQRITEVQP